MAARAKALEKNRGEWGEHMDIQVMWKRSSSQMMPGLRSAKKPSRITYYDGRCHFQVGHNIKCLLLLYFSS